MAGHRPIVWSAPLFDHSGFADEARLFVDALRQAGWDVRTDPFSWQPWRARLGDGRAERIERALAWRPPDEPFVHVVHGSPLDMRRHPQAEAAIARTVFETDSVPGASGLEAFDEIWVSSRFNVETFAAAGVPREKLHAIPQILPDHFRLETPSLPLISRHDGRFVFLSMFVWQLRKGWDVLTQAYLEEFDAGEPVRLVMKVSPNAWVTPTVEDARRQLDGFIRTTLGRDPADGPPIELLDMELADDELPSLYRAADAFVMPSRGEGWGRPYMEAMAVGLPTIGTRATGNLEFMTDENSYLVDAELVEVPEAAAIEVPVFRGRRWFEPSPAKLREAMRRVYAERSEAQAKGAMARAQILDRYDAPTVTAALHDRLANVAGTPPPPVRSRHRRPTLLWDGDQFVDHSLAIVNRELCRALLATDRVELTLNSDPPPPPEATSPSLTSLVRRVGTTRSGGDLCVRHRFPPDLGAANEPLVLMQPWEYGGVPVAWIEPIRRHVAELWVPSTHTRDVFVRNGIPPEQVVVVPHGVNPLMFNPNVAPLQLPTRKSFRFLFVGGTLFRKGADIVVETYLRTFGPDDDVCLVVKDFGTHSFYRGQGIGAQIRSAQADPTAPEILYLDEEWPHELLPHLYAACDCLVHPYRAEGFGLPIAEAMACGLPVVVTGAGACLDYCNPDVAHLIAASEARPTTARLGTIETVEPPSWAEVDRSALSDAMLRVVAEPDAAREMGLRASRHILDRFAWARAADAAVERVMALIERRTTTPVRQESRSSDDPSLSVCMIVRDEAEHLGRCLASVAAVADQVVVVDTGSTDDTVDIARAHGADVHEFEWIGDFAAARNESLRHATGDWVLVLDGDEWLDPGAHAELRRVIRNAGRGLVGYTVEIVNYTGAEGTEATFLHRTVRLFPNTSELRFRGRDPHAQVVPVADNLDYRVIRSDVVIHHEGYRPQTLAAKDKIERNRRYLEQAVAEEPDSAFHAFNLGVVYNAMGDHAAAERELLRAIALGPDGQSGTTASDLMITAYVALAVAAFELGRFGDAAAYARRATVMDPDLPDGHLVLGSALTRLGSYDQAWTAYEQALVVGDRRPIGASDRTAASWKPLLGMAEIHMARERWAAALGPLTRAHAVSPDDPRIALGVARTALGLGDLTTAHEILQAVAAEADAPPEVWLGLADVHQLRGDDDAAEAALETGRRRHPSFAAMYRSEASRPGGSAESEADVAE